MLIVDVSGAASGKFVYQTIPNKHASPNWCFQTYGTRTKNMKLFDNLSNNTQWNQTLYIVYTLTRQCWKFLQM